MSSRRRRTRPSASSSAASTHPLAPPPATHPPESIPGLAWAIAGIAAALAIAFSVSFELVDTDFWQHLLVGKAIWTLHRVPTTQLWTWPTYGSPDVNSSWGFRALIWPVWQLGGIPALFVWRWISTLAAFGILWLVARRIGARGLAPLLVFVVCGLVYRQRSQIRPETLVAVLLALELWILERRRTTAVAATLAKDRAWWLVPIAWAWANVHISYWLFFVVLGAHLVDALRRGSARPLWLVAAASLAISFVNPFGWRALWQPFEYALLWRHEPIFRDIGELWPIQWRANLVNGLPLIMVGWPLLLLLRAGRRGWDLAELVLAVAFTALAASTQRFLGFYALVAAPYAGRDLSAWLGSIAWPRWTRPRWLTAPVRAGTIAAACVLIGIPEWSRLELAPRIGFDQRTVPIRACDFLATHQIAGRSFNDFAIGGYVLWRFWPDRGRLPFMDVHQAGTPELRREYMQAFAGTEGWHALDQRYHFDWVLLSRPPNDPPSMLDVLDRDSSFALVFVDEAAALYLSRAGAARAVAEQYAYRVLPAGGESLYRLRARFATDPALRTALAAELQRSILGSRDHAAAIGMLGELAAFDGRFGEAGRMFARAAFLNPLAMRHNERLGVIRLIDHRPEAALQAFRRERALRSEPGGLDLRFAQAYQQLGDLRRARDYYRREATRGIYRDEAADSLRALDGRLAR